MSRRTRNIFISVICTVLFCYLISLFIDIYSDRQSPAGNIAGKLTTSSTSVSINNQPISSYDFKNSVYIVAQDLELFNFNITKDKGTHSVYVTTGKEAGINKKYLSKLSMLEEEEKVFYPTENVYINDVRVISYATKDYNLVPVSALNNIGSCTIGTASNTIVCTLFDNNEDTKNNANNEEEFSLTPPSNEPGTTVPTINATTPQSNTGTSSNGRVIVLDAGHGKSSSLMSDAEKESNGWVKNGGAWGEWRHWKSGTTWVDCQGSGCSGRAPSNGGCWYPIGYGDRETEPTLALNNTLAAKKYLEQMGYTVRLTRSSNNENPSITRRIASCYPNKDTSLSPDADAFICIHSNAGGGRGSCYMALSGVYDQGEIPQNYIDASNALGKSINDKIVASTGLAAAAGGRYEGFPTTILFCKSPVLVAYLEIGFYDNASDLAILQNSSDAIGKAIAEGIDAYFNN